jgi:hypothetical protein
MRIMDVDSSPLELCSYRDMVTSCRCLCVVASRTLSFVWLVPNGNSVNFAHTLTWPLKRFEC